MKLTRGLAGLFFILAAGLSACGSLTPTPEAEALPTVLADKSIVVEGRLEPIHYANLALSASGLVSEVLFKEGDKVAAGEVIARLESAEAQTLEDAQAKAAQELTQAYKEVRDAQYEFDNFDVPQSFSGMTPREAVRSALEDLNVARANFEPYKHRSEKSLKMTESEQKTGQYNDLAKVYKKRLDNAWANYRKAIRWMDLETNLSNAKARLANAQKDYDALSDPNFAADTAGLRAALANAELRAPFSGVITKLGLKVGEFAASGQSLVSIADVSNWVVKTIDLTEMDVASVKEGQAVIVKLDALPGITLNGHVLSISQSYAESQGDIVYEATILLTETHPSMRWGMTAEVVFNE